MADGAPQLALGRASLVLLALIGAGLVAAPFAFDMFDRAPKGATMISAFRPFMTAERLGGFQREIREINLGVVDSETAVAAYLEGRPTTSARARFDARFPDFAAFESQWRVIDGSMSAMLDTIRANLGNYLAVAALPSFTLFPWFFVLPGVIIIVLLLVAALRPRSWIPIRWALVVLGIGLIAAPLAFEMFERAPKGQRMMSAFKPIETRTRVETIQGYFGEMVTGQGAVRLELVPALEQAGLSLPEIAVRFPGVTTLDRRWVSILNDMTPLVGAMSDNVGNYGAVASLPPFGFFPWFFVVPGLLVIGLALSVQPRPRLRGSAAVRISNSIPFRPKGAP